MPTKRAIVRAAIVAAYPETPGPTIDEALDLIATTAIAVDIAATTPGVTTADELEHRLVADGIVRAPVDAADEPAGDVLPQVDVGCEIVECVKLFDKVWPDSGRVRTLVLRREDGTEIKSKFGADREATWRAACAALGVSYEADWKAIQGRRAVVEIIAWAPPSGGDPRPIVKRWAARPGTPRAIEKATAAAEKAARAEAKRSRNAVDHPTDDDVAF